MGLKRHWLAWRNRKLSDPAVQRRLAAFPLTRPIARRRASAMFDLVAGFTYSQILAATVESGLLDLLRTGPRDLAAIATATGLSEAAAARLVRGAAALDLVEPIADEWTLGEQGAALAGNAGAQAMIAHHHLLYAELADPMALLRADRSAPTALSDFWTYAPTNADAGTYSQLMAASQAMVAEQVLDAFDVTPMESLLDVGGGHGAFASAVLDRAPDLRVGVVDLPSVIDGMAEPLRKRVALHPADFFRDALPDGYSAASLVRILHDHDDGPALDLLHRIRGILPAGGRLLIAEPMADTPGAERMGDAYFGLYLWAMRSGRPRRTSEIFAMLESAGFRSCHRVPTTMPIICSLIVARS